MTWFSWVEEEPVNFWIICVPQNNFLITFGHVTIPFPQLDNNNLDSDLDFFVLIDARMVRSGHVTLSGHAQDLALPLDNVYQVKDFLSAALSLCDWTGGKKFAQRRHFVWWWMWVSPYCDKLMNYCCPKWTSFPTKCLFFCYNFL